MKNRHLAGLSLLIMLLASPAAAPGTDSDITGTITDQVGRKISLAGDPQRVVALAPSITEIIFALGREDRLKGVTMFSDYPAAATRLPRVGSYVHLDVEKIVALEPDVCIAVKDGNPLESIKQLEGLGIDVYAVHPTDLGSVMETTLEIGRLLNATERAQALVRDMSSRIERVKARVAQTTNRPRVFFQIGLAPIVAVGTRTHIHELIKTAGGENLSQGPAAYPRFSWEQILALGPEVVIVTSMARVKAFDKVEAQWNTWSSLPAVRDNRVHVVDSNIFDRPTPRMVEGLELLVQLLHPQADNAGRK